MNRINYWRKFSEELPLPDQEVLVYDSENEIYISDCSSDWKDFLKFNVNITHWMPLPEKPRKDKSALDKAKHYLYINNETFDNEYEDMFHLLIKAIEELKENK